MTVNLLEKIMEAKAYRETAGKRELLILENEHVRVVVWPEMGAALLDFVDKASGLDIIFKNPNCKVAQRHLMTQPVQGFSDLYDVLDGSWFLSLPTGFHPTQYYGAPIGAHGEFRSLEWEVEILESGPERARVKVTGNSVRTPLVMERIWELGAGSRTLAWEETLHNRSGKERGCAWLHHPAFGGDLIVGAELRVPAATVVHDFKGAQLVAGHRGPWPKVPLAGTDGSRDCSKVPEADSGVDHSIQLTDFEVGWGCLWNEERQLGFAMRWDENFFPWAWSWAHAGGNEDYPMWGQGHLITLQPGTSPVGPWESLLESGQVKTIPAGGSVQTRMLTGFTNDPDAVWELT